MIKICHLADVHWRSLSRHKEYKNSFSDAFEKMKKLKPDVILIAGDIVHSKTQGITPELITNLTWWFREMSKIAQVHVTLGNHDGLILNPDREDAISPIINAIDDFNIKLYKNSGVYPIHNDYNLAVFSCFDEENWKNVKPEPGKTNIATFHGSVRGSLTDEDWELDSDVKSDFFDGFDYVMLGDIHKQQFLTNKIAYCGSTIQQNYGESPDKGFLFWAIDKQEFRVKHVSVYNDSPFVTLDYSGDVDSLQTEIEKYPKRSRFRIKIDEHLSQAERVQIKAAIKNVATPEEIVFKSEEANVGAKISNDVLDDNDALDNYDAIWKLINEYYAKADIDQKTVDLMAKGLLDAWNKAKISDEITSGRWSVKKLEFDNVFGYGEGNVVNFDAMSGITGIFGKNRSGKSSICGALTYALFNGTDRGPMKNVHIVNARKNYCRAKVVINKKGNNILIDRQTTKKVNKKGEISAMTHLNLFECDETGTPIRDLSDEQRRETEKVLRQEIGNLDDFLLTSLASQGDINRFVSKGSAERKSILAKFLRLDILDDLQTAVRAELAASKLMMQKMPEKEFDSQICDYTAKIAARKTEREEQTSDLEKINKILTSIRSMLESQDGSDQKYSMLEVETQESTVSDLQNSVNLLSFEIDKSRRWINALNEKLNQTKSETSDVDVKSLLTIKKQAVDTEKNLLITNGDIENKTTQLKSDKREIKKLSDVPCGDAFPTCKYIISAKKAEKLVQERQSELESIKSHANFLKNELKKIDEKNIDEILAKKASDDEKIQTIKHQISDHELKLVRLESRFKNTENQYRDAALQLDKMKMNVCDNEVAQQRDILVKKKKLAEEKFENCKIKIQSLSEKIGTFTAQVEQLHKDKKIYEENSLQNLALTLLSKALGKDGIPLQIVKRKLPIINREIANILIDVTGFSVELDSDNSGMDIILDYGDSRRVIECCSGMEKMMASLAIRTALIRVSSLPKSDILIIDEGFGALDSSNIEACTGLLRSLTKTFKSILIISHIDTVKDVVDNIIEISTNGVHDAKVEFS